MDGEVNVVAPGELILSAWPPDTTQVLQGTSQAVAFAGGIAAMWAEAKAERGINLWKRLQHSVLQIGCKREECGWGLVQAP